MSFEVIHSDLSARIGKLHTKSAVVETPLFLPVINPNIPSPSPRQMYEDFRAEAVITNAYILRKHFAEKIKSRIHSFLDFPGAVMTDSGAYQILKFGSVETDPLEIVKFQEDINSDIAVILDVPTGWRTTHSHAKKTVEETLTRARKALEARQRDDVLWVGPVQGGKYLDLVSWSAEQTAKLPFDLHALGSPTEVMEQYHFDTLVEMIFAAKSRLPTSRPFHLFGAGHPMVLPIAVASGCDLFDSAAYSIYARNDRYLTHTSTFRLEEMTYLPCSCAVCSRTNPQELMKLHKPQRQQLLAEHNLHVTFSQVRQIKEAILNGRLWELLEQGARAHPALMRAFRSLERHRDELDKGTPRSKNRGLFFADVTSLSRPEVARHQRKIIQYGKPGPARILLLLPNPSRTPFHTSLMFRNVKKILRKLNTRGINSVHVCFYGPPFGLTPLEIDDCYPMSQFESAINGLENRLSNDLSTLLKAFLKVQDYLRVMLVLDPTLLRPKDVKNLEKLRVKVTRIKNDLCSADDLAILEKALRVFLRGRSR